jgi:ribonuclease PH
MRADSRQNNQLRAVTIVPNYLKTAEGSALISVGDTQVLCAASVETSVPPFLRNSGKGWVTAEYAMLPRATGTRTPREVTKGRPSGRTHEIQRLIGRSLRATIDLAALGERSIFIDCDVLQADGGTRVASITGSYVALALAVKKMVAFKMVPKSPLTGMVAAISVGIQRGETILDLNYEEDSQAEVDANVVMTDSGRYVEFQATAENRSFDDAQMDEMRGLARAGIQQLIAIQKSVIESAK